MAVLEDCNCWGRRDREDGDDDPPPSAAVTIDLGSGGRRLQDGGADERRRWQGEATAAGLVGRKTSCRRTAVAIDDDGMQNPVGNWRRYDGQWVVYSNSGLHSTSIPEKAVVVLVA